MNKLQPSKSVFKCILFFVSLFIGATLLAVCEPLYEALIVLVVSFYLSFACSLWYFFYWRDFYLDDAKFYSSCKLTPHSSSDIVIKRTWQSMLFKYFRRLIANAFYSFIRLFLRGTQQRLSMGTLLYVTGVLFTLPYLTFSTFLLQQSIVLGVGYAKICWEDVDAGKAMIVEYVAGKFFNFHTDNILLAQIIIDLLVLFRKFRKATCAQDRAIAIYEFIRLYYTLEQQIVMLKTVFTSEFSAHSGTDHLLKMRSVLDNWKDLSESDILLKTQRMLKAFLFGGLAAKLGLTIDLERMEFILGKSSSGIAFGSFNDMMYSLVDLGVTFAETGYECFCDKSLRPILVRDRAILAWADSVRDIIDTIENIPTTNVVDIPSILGDADIILGRGNALMVSNPRYVTPLYKKLSETRTQLARKHNASSNRRPPFSVLIHGPPGIGKSSVCQSIATIFHRTVVAKGFYPNLEWIPGKNRYNWNERDKFWSGFAGASHWFVVLDDIAREHVNIIKTGKSEVYNTIIDTVNVNGVITPQAAIEDKGAIPLLPKLVAATTNIKDLHASFAASEPTAILRRFPIVIEPILKPEFCGADGMMRKDLSSVTHDAWMYRIETYKITNHQGRIRGEYIPFCPEPDRVLCTGEEMSSYISEAVVKHENSSSLMMDALDVADDVNICEHGVLSYFTCSKCVAPITAHAYIDGPETGPSRLPWWMPSWNPAKLHLTLCEWFYIWFLDRAHGVMDDDDFIWLMVYFFNFCPNASKCYIVYITAIVERKYPERFLAFKRLVITALAAGGITAICHFISKLWFTNSFDVQSGESDENIWQKGSHHNENYVAPITKNTGNLEELCNSIRKSIFHLHVKGDDSQERVSGICVGPSQYMFPSHPFLKGDKWSCIADYQYSQSHMSSKQGVTITLEDIQFLPNDLCVITHAGFLARKDLSRFFGSQDRAGRQGYLVNLGFDGGLTRVECNTSRMKEASYVSITGVPIKGTFMMGKRTQRHSMPGDCGSLMLSEVSGGYVITGIQTAGLTGDYTVAFAQVSKSIIPDPPHSMLLSPHGDIEPHYFRGSSSTGPLGPPFRKGIHHYVTSCNAHILGSYPGGVTPVSHVEPTIVSSRVAKAFDFTVDTGAPPMKPFVRDGEWFNPWTIAAEAQGKISPHFSMGDVMRVAESFVADTTVDSSWLKDCRISTLHEAINGIPGCSFIDSLPMSTSGGMYFTGKKRKFFLGEPGNYTMGPELQKHYDELLGVLESGCRSQVVFNGTLKDEARPISKNLEGKTRVFSACDVAFSIIVRQQYLTVAKAMMENNLLTECAVGMNAYKSWHHLAMHLIQFGDDRMIAGDYKNYDKQIPPLFIRAAFHVLDRWRSFHIPISRVNANIARGVATDIAFPIINMNKELVQFYGGNPSGHPLTALVNSIVNSMLVRFAYSKIGYPLSTFKQNVALVTLGDDNIMGSRIDEFNHTSLSSALRDYGVTYTMADKKSESVPFIHISQVDFLKRSFLLRDGEYFPALNLKSVMKSLTMWVKSPHVSPFEHLAACYLSARIEWSIHGKEVFDTSVAKMEFILADEDLSPVRDFLIKRHAYTWERTLAWIQGKLDDSDTRNDDTYLYGDLDRVNLTALEASLH